MPREFSSLQHKRYAWELAWISKTPATYELREKWGHDRKRFISRFRLDDDEQQIIQQEAMRYFDKVLASLTYRRQLAERMEAGRRATSNLITAMLTSSRETPTFDLLSIDFEGTCESGGVKEFGAARLDASHHSSTQAHGPEKLMIESENFANASHRHRKFAFGTSTKVSPELLPRMVAQQIEGVRSTHEKGKPVFEGRKIVLVGHGIDHDLKYMAALGTPLEQFEGVIGIVDTCQLAREVLGQGMSLRKLLETLRIPFKTGQSHCAGNDAHYTLRAMLALLYLQAAGANLDESVESTEELGSLKSVVLQPVRSPHGIDMRKQTVETVDECFDSTLFADQNEDQS